MRQITKNFLTAITGDDRIDGFQIVTDVTEIKRHVGRLETPIGMDHVAAVILEGCEGDVFEMMDDVADLGWSYSETDLGDYIIALNVGASRTRSALQ